MPGSSAPQLLPPRGAMSVSMHAIQHRRGTGGVSGAKKKKILGWPNVYYIIHGNTVKPLITDPPKSGQPLYSGRLTCPRLILP